ncbi:MAG: hypothetical protein ACOYJZ_09825 [Acutalibacter sp.]
MSRAKEAVQAARFLAKGKWYLAQDVDHFLEELTVRLEEDGREQEELNSRVNSLQEECQRLEKEASQLRQELAERKAVPAAAMPASPAESRRGRCWELEEERDELIQDIKALLHFREEFRQAVQQDVEGILGQLDELSSQKLL